MRKVLRLIPLGMVVASLLILGRWGGNQQAARVDAEMRQNLLWKAVELSDLINPQLAKQLTFTEADKDLPAYQLIREQLTRAGKSLPQHGIYTMALREGKIFFGPENYSPEDPMASPPGTEYEKPSKEDLEIFTKKQPVTIGPVTDEYGIFVTAIAPVFDPKNGQVLMTVGIDILASDWKASLEDARRGPFFSMVALALLMILGAAAIHWKNRQMKSSSLKLKNWIFVPMVLALGMGCLVYGIYQYHAFREAARNNMFRTMEQVRRQWNRSITSKVQILKLQAESITHDSAVLNAWQAKDREALAMLVGPDFELLKREHDISRYYFIEPDGVCLLRAHQPEKQGDLTESFTLKMAERSGSDFWGVELDPLGSLTLSYVRPVQRGGTLIGFLKLEVENGPILQSIASEMHLEILVSPAKGIYYC